MSEQTELENLSFLELNVLLQHLRLGVVHLKKHLNQNQLNDLLSLGELKEIQQKNIKSDAAEKTGNAALLINTVITSVFGAWMGFAGFMQMKLGSMFVLYLMVALATLISGLVGFYSFKLIKSQTKNSIVKQKINNVQLRILKTLNLKRQNDIRTLLDQLNTTLVQLDDNQETLANKNMKRDFSSKEVIAEWLNCLNKILASKVESLPHEPIYQLYIDELAFLKKRLKIVLSKNLEIKEEKINSQNSALSNKRCRLKHSHDGQSFIKILTNPNTVSPKTDTKRAAWLKTNKLSILLSLIPTLLGCFASMFVFLSGGPNLAKEFNMPNLVTLLTSENGRIVEFSMALLLTFYYSFSSIYINRKNFARDQELEKSRKEINNEEAHLIEANAKINMLEKVKIQLRRISYLFKILNRISVYLNEQQTKLEEYKKLNQQLKQKQKIELEKVE